MIDVISSTFSSTSLTYPQVLNQIWRGFLISGSSIINNPGTNNLKTGNPVPHFFIQQDAKHNPICLTYDPVIGLTSIDKDFPSTQGKEPYNFAVPAKIEEEAVMFIGMNPSYIPSNSKYDYDDYWGNKPLKVNKAPVPLAHIDAITGWQFEEFYHPDSIFCNSTYFEDLRKLTAAFYIAKINGRTNYMTGSDTSSEKDGEAKYNICIEGKRIPNYAHLDLLAIRHTKQKDIEGALTKYYNNTYPDFVDFINAQIDIFKELLQAAKPKVIIVNSGLASNILRNNEVFFQDDTSKYNTDIWKDLRSHLGMRLYWDDSISAYRWSKTPFNAEGELKKKDDDIPVFLCGMTSGQRALDSGRREELIAQVANVITQNDHSKNNFLQTH